MVTKWAYNDEPALGGGGGGGKSGCRWSQKETKNKSDLLDF